MVDFDAAHKAVHYPPDRRFRVWISRPFLIGIGLSVLALLAVAWVQRAVFGLPIIPTPHNFGVIPTSGPHGFPSWVRWSHFYNMLFLFMLIRSGLSILMDHPRLYWNEDCTPGSEWIRFTPIKVPTDRMWTAKDDARYISPVVATPGYRHTVGIARCWHFLNVYGFIFVGIFFVSGLLTSDQWMRIVPTSTSIFADAWGTFVWYANFHLPFEPNGFYGYNALQQLVYFATIVVMAPLMIMTGMAMSPAMANRFPKYVRLFHGRQGARSIHFMLLVGWIMFIVIHVSLVVITGFVRNMNHIVLGVDNQNPMGAVLGCIGIAVVILYWFAAHFISWHMPRALQHMERAIIQPIKLMTLDRLNPREHYTIDQISPHFWPNGKMPVREDWKEMASDGFKNYRLKVSGLVENPIELSLEDLRKLGEEENITMHHCIQGWSGIAQWGGLPLSTLIKHVKPFPYARTIVFYSFGAGLYSETYYDTQTISDALKPECLLAYEMNGKSLPLEYGAPLRLRTENQLGYKMVKWIERIEFVMSEKEVGLGMGGTNEDDEYFDLIPTI